VKIAESPDTMEVVELVSYRGKFTEQAVKGDRVKFRGRVEEALYPSGTRCRIMLGGRGDYLVYMLWISLVITVLR
jgi:predicted nucleotidyltransferase